MPTPLIPPEEINELRQQLLDTIDIIRTYIDLLTEETYGQE